MKRKKTIKLLVITSIFLFSTFSGAAQKLMNSVGLTLSVLQGTLHEGAGYESFGVEQNNATWFPSIILLKAKILQSVLALL